MLKLLLGRDWTANRTLVLSQIADDVKNGRGGRILMVPELISHDTERRLCAAAGDTASRYAEVLSFTRLARRVADLVGSAAEECLDNGGRVVAMAAAARQLHSKLKAYAAVETKPEFLTELLDAIDEFKRCCITSADLLAASAQTEGSLAQKLEELALLLEAYDSLTAQGKRDPRDQMTWLLEQLEDGTFGENHVFYIDGFPDFTRQHLAILEHLIRVSPCVTVSLNCDGPDSRLLAFEKAASTAKDLIRCAKRADVPVQIIKVPGNANPLAPLRERLYQGPIPELSGGVTACQSESVYQECMAAAEEIGNLIRSGCRYRDISLVCTDAGKYRHILKLTFRRCGIPLYLSGTESILDMSVISAVLSALDAALGGFDQRDVLRYLRSAISPLDVDTCDQVENYAIVWGIRGSRFLRPWESHPDGLGQDWTEEAASRLAALNAAREEALAPLERLSRGFRDAKKLSDQVTALYGFLEEICLSDRLDAMAKELDLSGDNRSAQILNQLWEILLLALEQMYDVLGSTAWDGDTFTRLFSLLLSQYDVGTIPPVLDAVVAGPVSAMRCQQAKHLFILGAQEGSLPGYGGSKGVLTDQERVALREMGVPLTGGAMDGLQAEFAEIYGVVCGAEQTLWISYPGGQPSFVFKRISQMAGGVEKAHASFGPALTDTREAAFYLARWDAQETAESLGISDAYENAVRSRAHTLGAVSADHIHSLYGKTLKLSASQVDTQADCRLSYFLKYGLRARERKEATVDPAEFGTFVHAVLEKTARAVMDLGGFHDITEGEVLSLAAKFAEEYIQERFADLDSSRLAYLFQRNGRELDMVVSELWRELSQSAFQPVDFETAFGDNEKMPPIEIPASGMDAQLRGFVDRVDAWQANGQNYFRVVDYKTGKKDFDYCDVFNGRGLQMLLYMFALEQGGQKILGDHAISAGVQYFPARVKIMSSDGRLTPEEAEKEREKDWKRRGLLLSDPEVLDAMCPEDAPNRLCVTRKKDGTITGDLADRDQMKQLKAYVYALLGRIVDEIASGDVTPNPYTRGTSHNACTFCPYGAVCSPDTVEGRRNYKMMTAQRFWEEIGKELKNRG